MKMRDAQWEIMYSTPSPQRRWTWPCKAHEYLFGIPPGQSSGTFEFGANHGPSNSKAGDSMHEHHALAVRVHASLTHHVARLLSTSWKSKLDGGRFCASFKRNLAWIRPGTEIWEKGSTRICAGMHQVYLRVCMSRAILAIIIYKYCAHTCEESEALLS